jgi:hypothetical protein
MTDPHPERPPFWKHRHAYLTIKILVLLAGLVLALKLINVV